MSYARARDGYVAVFGGHPYRDGGYEPVSRVIGSWDHDHEESGMGSYSCSYAHEVVRAGYEQGVHPWPQLALYGYDPGLPPGPLPGSPDVHYFGAFRYTKFGESSGRDKQLFDDYVKATTRLRLCVERPLPDAARAIAAATEQVDASSLDGDGGTAVLWETTGRDEWKLRELRKQLHRAGARRARIVRKLPRAKTVLAAAAVVERYRETMMGIGHPIEAVLADLRNEPPPAPPTDKYADRCFLTDSARDELRNLLPYDNHHDALVARVAKAIMALDDDGPSPLGLPESSSTDVREHIVENDYRVWSVFRLSMHWVIRIEWLRKKKT